MHCPHSSNTQEVIIIRKMAPINLIVYYPKTDEGRLELAHRVAEVHANAVQRRIKELNCPNSQKLALLDAVIEDARKRVLSTAESKELSPGQRSHGTPPEDRRSTADHSL